jgi:hypothetical protein
MQLPSFLITVLRSYWKIGFSFLSRAVQGGGIAGIGEARRKLEMEAG